MRRIAAREPLIKSSPRRSLAQRGQVLLILLAILGIGFGVWFYTFAGRSGSTVERDKITAAALAQAKAALIGYAAGVSDLAGGERPGDLPCPDMNDSSAFGSSCDTQASRIGRLPWKRLGLGDLRDGDGERLWYAVSDNFKRGTRTACVNPGDAGCLNSDARGTITVRNSSGTVVNDGFTPSGVIAVIFAPGAVLQRQDTGNVQDRSCTGGTCTAVGVCATGSPAKCNPANYLDILNGVEDNADFTDSSSTNGFINGVIRDAAGNAIVNDRLIVITYQDLMPVLQRRVAMEVLNCLKAYAALPQNGGPINGRYPWAVPVANVTLPPPNTYADQVDWRYGRVPDFPLSATQLGVAGGVADLSCPASPTVCMSNSWPFACGITQGPMVGDKWWTNWKEMVFYGVADAYKPADPILGGGVPASGGCGSCLTVNQPPPAAAATNKRVVVIVAGKRLAAAVPASTSLPFPGPYPQPLRTGNDRKFAYNYMEGENDNPDGIPNIYEQKAPSASFNDFLLYQ